MNTAPEAGTYPSSRDVGAQADKDFIASHRGKHVAITSESFDAARDVAIGHWQLGLMERQWLVIMTKADSPFIPTELLKS